MEYWDIYDKNKKPTGRLMERNNWILKDDEYHLTALGIVKRSDGKYLITKRALDKVWAPGWWEVSGGAVMAGETSEQAAVREVFEETGIDVSCAKREYVLTYHRENPGKGDNYFVDVYRFTADFTEEDVKPALRETTAFMIVDKTQIEKFAQEGIFLHYDSIKQAFE